MKTVTLSIEQITDLFTGLGKLPQAVNREPTFMEIAGYPHFENVCSNILAFYLQPINEHGFGTLFLDVLAKLIDKEIVIGGQSIEVKREELTKNGKRIDLVIESENFVVGIENKIFAGLYSPFQEYSEHLDSLSNGRQVCKVLLSLRSIQPSPELYGFKPICYEDFFQKVVDNIGSCFLTAHEPHITFLRDFIQTLRNLQKVTMMDRQRLNYFRDNQKNIAILLNEVDDFRKDMRRKVQLLNEAVTFEDISTYQIKSGLWKPSMGLTSVNWYIVEIDDSFWLQLNIFLTPAGWTIVFSNKKGTIDRVRQWLKDRDIEVETSVESNDWLVYTGKDNSHPYEAEIEDIRMWTIGMLKGLTASTADRSTDISTSLISLNSVDRSNHTIPLSSKAFSLNN
jgi:PD-(D/E)XK nuclease superfamily